MYLNLRLSLWVFGQTTMIEAISILELFKIVLHRYHGGIKSKKCNKIAKEIWLWCFKTTLSSRQQKYQENTILKQTNFQENLTIKQNGTLILRLVL